MPVYNGKTYIRAAVNSLLVQTYTNFEMIISDNASTDSTEAICQEYGVLDPRIRYVRHSQNQGPITNFEFVLNEARGKYFMWAAHDDVWEPTYLQTLVDLLQRNPAALLAFSRFDNIDRVGRRCRTFKEDWPAVFAGAKWSQFLRFILADPAKTQKANHIYGLFRTDNLRDRGGLECLADDYAGCDIVTLFDLLIMGNFVVRDEVLFHYRDDGRYRMKVLVKGSIGERAKKHPRNVWRGLFRLHLMHGGMRAYVPKAPRQLRSFLYVLLAISELLTSYRSCVRICARDMRTLSTILFWKMTDKLR
jgi:glycosyltransferase involved in cell wall biosynthesis